MKKTLFLKSLLLFNGILLILTSCPSYPSFPTGSIPKTNPLVLTSATEGMADVTSSSRQISITVTMQIDQACPSGSNWNILSLTVTPKGETEKELIKVYLSCDAVAAAYWGGDLFSSDEQLSYTPYKTYKTFNAVVTVDLDKGLAWLESNTGSENEYISKVDTISADPSWTFDKTTKIHLCSGKDGAASAVACTISRLQVTSKLTSILGNLADFTPVSKAFYPLTGGPSTGLLSTITPASSAYFGDKASSPTAGTSPSWDSSNDFVKITSQTQFLTFPLPSITEDPVLVTTMSVAMWLRVSSIPGPASTATIFSLLYPDGRTAYTVTADPTNLALTVYFKGSKISSPNTLGITLNTWQLITFSLYSTPSSSQYAQGRIFVDDTSTFLVKYDTTGEFLSATELRIGDAVNSFIGDVSAVRILSPGVGNLTSIDLCDSDSAIQIGFGPYSISCSKSGSFNPYNNKCYASCPVDIITLGEGAPVSLCLTEEEEKGSTPGGVTVEESGGLSTGAIIGIVLGSLFGLLFIIIVGYLIRTKCMASHVKSGVKRRKTEENELETPKKPLAVRSNMVSPTVEEEIRL